MVILGKYFPWPVTKKGTCVFQKNLLKTEEQKIIFTHCGTQVERSSFFWFLPWWCNLRLQEKVRRAQLHS